MMTPTLTAKEMRAIEAKAMASGAVSGLELMERAGQGVVQAICEEWPELAVAGTRAVVLCGPGNNGGDGFVVARLLLELGLNVDVFFFGDADRLPPDARTNFDRFEALGPIVSLADDNFLPGMNALNASLFGASLAVDSFFGIGLTRDVPHVVSDVAQDLPPYGVPVIAVDLPSGLCADTGRVFGAAIPADLTVTFHSLKQGHVTGEGPALCGKVVVKDIGL